MSELTDKMKSNLEEMVNSFIVACQEIGSLTDPVEIEGYMRQVAPRKGFSNEQLEYAIAHMHKIAS